MKKDKKTTTKNPDITEHKRAEERLARLSLQNELILSSAAEGILGLDLQGNHTFINPAAARMLGYEVEELIGRHSHSTWHHTKADGSPYPKEECDIYAAYRDGVVHHASNEVFWRKDGTSFPVEYASTPIYEQGRLAGAVVTFTDITERKQAQEALQERLKELNCLYGISAILEVPGISLDEILKRIVLVMPPAWQFPDITEACIVLRGQTFQTEHFRETSWMQVSEIVVNGKTVGQIRVCYLEERHANAEGPFLAEERRLLDAIAERLGRVIERVWAEEALQHSEERYRSLYVDSMDAVMILSLNEGFLSGNPATVKMFGCRDEQDFVSRTPASLSPEYQPDGALSVGRSREMMQIALEKGSHSFEWVHRRADGTDFNATVLLSRMEIGGKRLLQATVRDITERKKAADALLESEVKYRLLFDNAADAIFLADAETAVILDANYAAEELIGRPRDEIIGMNRIELHPKKEIYKNQFLQHIEETFVSDAESEVLHKDGRVIPVLITARVIELAGRKVIQGIFRNITERKTKEDQILSLNEQQKIILDASPALIFYKDKENRFIRVNEALANANGLSKEEMEGKTMWDLYPREAAEHYWQDDKKVMAAGKPALNIIEEMKTPLGTRWVQTDKVPYRNLKGEIIGIIGFTLDITERKKAEEALIFSNIVLSTQQETSIDGILVVDENGRIVSYNRLFVDMWNIPPDVVESKSDERALQSVIGKLTNPEEFISKVQHLYENRQEKSRDEIVLKDGRTFDRYSAPMLGADGTYFGRVWYFRDITERKRTQEALRQFVDRLSLATRAGGVGIWDYDVIDNKLIWDDQMYHLYGITQDKFGGAYEAWRAGLHPEDMQRGDDEIQMALRGEKEFDTEFRVLWPDGTIRNIRALAIMQRDASGKPLRMIGTNWDITERKQAEAEREKTIQELQSAIEQIKTLKGLVPICAWCKKIRNDKGYWEQVEAYVSRYTEAQFSHGICPDCVKKAYPEFSKDEKTDSK